MSVLSADVAASAPLLSASRLQAGLDIPDALSAKQPVKVLFHDKVARLTVLKKTKTPQPAT